MTKSKLLSLVFYLLSLPFVASAQELRAQQLVVPLAEGGFVAFKSETAWADIKKASAELQKVPSALTSQALVGENRIIHRVLLDKSGRFVFGYDLWVAPDPASRQFKIAVRPLDPQFESRIRARNPSGPEPPQAEIISTFPKSTDPHILDDGDAFSLDLLVNQTTGVKIVDVVRVTFDRANLWAVNPRLLARDFTLDAVELVMKAYTLFINDEVVAMGKTKEGVNGALLWFYVPDRGRFIFSLVPREGYAFQKVGIIEDNKIEFTVGGNHYQWLSSASILPGDGAWNLWVLHDPKYTPFFGPEPVPAQEKQEKSALDKLDATLRAAAERIRNQKQNALGNSNDAPGSQNSQAAKRPRVVVGGADRIENLWPRNP